MHNRGRVGLRAVLPAKQSSTRTPRIALHQTGRLIEHWIPLADIRDDLLEATGSESSTPWKVKVGRQIASGEVRGYESQPGRPRPDDRVNLKDVALDRWYEDDDSVYSHLRDRYHRVNVGQSGACWRLRLSQFGGDASARTVRA